MDNDYLSALESFVLQNKEALEFGFYGKHSPKDPMDDPDYVEFVKESFKNCLDAEETDKEYQYN